MRIVCVCKLCTPPALKHDIPIQTRHNVRLPVLPILLQFILPSFHCAGGSLSAGVHTLGYPGVDPWRYQVAKCACSAGPDLGSLSSHRCSCLLLPPLFLYVSICLTQMMRWVPCTNHGHVGTQPISTAKPFASVHGSFVNNLLAPSLQFASLSTYSNHARASSDASSR